MWSWLLGGGNANSTNASGSSGGLLGRGSRLASFLGAKREFTLANMQQLHHQLLRSAELPDAEIVELLRVLSEFLIYSDQNRADTALGSPPSVDFSVSTSSAGVFFDYFCEKNILTLLVALGESKPHVAVQIQLLQTLSILVQNIATRTSLYYLLSNNSINKLLECPFAYDQDDDVRDWFVTLLKALSLRLNEDTVQFFFDSESNKFPLYSQALRFGRCSETMIKVAVKTLMLNVLKVQDDRVRTFLLTYQKMAYFADVVEVANEMALKIQGLLNIWTPTASTVNDKLEEAIDAYIDHCFYLQDILDVNLPELCYKVGDLLYTRHVKHLLCVSILPNCNPPPQRISTRLALYLLTRLLGILEHAPLVNAISFLLLSPDAHERSQYATVSLGAGSFRKSKSSRKTPTIKEESATTSKEAAAKAATEEGVARPTKDEETKPPRKSSRKKTSSSRRRIVFRAHSAGECNSPVCYLQTRYSHGEWPLDEVRAFELEETNVFRQSLVTLLESSDEALSSTALLVILAVINNGAVDHSLLREMDLLPHRFRKHHHHHHKSLSSKSTDATGAEAEEGSGESSQASESSTSSATEDGPADDADADSADCKPDQPATETAPAIAASSSSSQWLIDCVLRLLNRSADVRLLSTQLCARLLLDLVWDRHASQQEDASRLTSEQANALVAIHSVCTHQVMQSMRGAMADVDLFVYVLEDEYTDFQKTTFPMTLTLKASSPYEFLVPLLSPSSDVSDHKPTLHLRHPVNEMEVCRKAMRTFLIVRRLRELADPHYVDDNLNELVAHRHPHTEALASVAPSRLTVESIDLNGMVFLKCIWREQRFLSSPARLLMAMNPEALAFVERDPTHNSERTDGDEGDRGFVRLFAPIHRVYATLDSKDELVLHFTISSAVPVEGCRSYRKAAPKENSGRNALKSWHASVLFENAEDAKQAKANVDLSRAEVRAFKLLKIEEALSAHVQITGSHSASAGHPLEHQDSIASSADEESSSVAPTAAPTMDDPAV